MRNLTAIISAGLFLWGNARTAISQEPPSFSKQVRPFLAKYCSECHNADEFKGGLNLESFKTLSQGGNNGPVLAPGLPDKSRIVRLVEGLDKPKMPPKKAPQPRAEEMAVLRAWVVAGAKDDSLHTATVLPKIVPRIPVQAPVAALAYRPDGTVLAVGHDNEVLLLDVVSGAVVGRLPGQAGSVTALAYSPDGSRLAVAAGRPGTSGELHLYPATGNDKPEHVIPAHRDMILALAWSPDGRVLASTGFDRLIKLWDAATGSEGRTLKDHSDAVYGLAFSPDGTLLASGSADRAVKVWQVQTGRRLYTLAESTDWVYSVAWSPDGRRLAAGSVDKSIRLWEVSPTSGRLVQAVFAHEGPVSRLVYSGDGKILYSLGEDRTAKAWDAARMVERTVYPRQPDAVLSLAVRGDQRQIALGRYDGSLVLLEEATGKVQAEPLPVKPKPPQAARISPTAGPRGQKIRLTVEGTSLQSIHELVSNLPGVKAAFLPNGITPNRVDVDITFPETTGAGVYQLSLRGPAGQTVPLPFTVDLYPAVAEKEPNDSPLTGQRVTLPTTVAGAIDQPGDVDYYRFDATAGQEVGVQAVVAGTGTKLESILQLTDSAGHVLAESTHGVLGYTCPRAGVYALGIRDREYRGGAEFQYRLHLGDIPVITSVFPLGLQRGAEAEIHVDGVHLGKSRVVKAKAATDAGPGSRQPVAVSTSRGPALGNATLVVGEFPEVSSAGNSQAPTPMPAPGTANGRLTTPAATDTWRFTAHKGQPLILEVNARRIGSPVDSYIEILDAGGRPLPRTTLRCVAKTYVTFRDHDSAGSGIRIETWGELAINDHLLVGDELVRIFELPKNPDDDCQFYSVAGQREAYLGTTPTHHSLGTPMYKVALHPPGTTFPPNGLPVVTLYYRNDDGGPGYGKDSMLYFEPPADGDYLVRVGDSRGLGGPDFGYRLTVRPPRPSFSVSINPPAPSVWRGGAVPVTVTAERIDGFDGPIHVQLTNLPPGFNAPATTIPAGENSTTFALMTEPTAANPANLPAPRLVARARIGAENVTREIAGGLPKVVEPGDLVTTTEQSEVTVRPGGEVRMTARIERRKGFNGRVPLEVRGLPHGVRVLDIGLNGILVTEKESSRTFVIYAEPWVQPTSHPFVVLAKNEGKSTEYAARSVLLRVVPGGK